MTQVVAVIPARAGSRRVPRKNIRPFLGIAPLVRAIDTINQSRAFDAILVSTDDPETAAIALANGAAVPAFRPTDLADDVTPTRPVIVHAIEHWIDWSVDVVGCVYPVTPLLRPDLLRQAVDLAATSSGYVFPVERSRYPVQRAIELDAQGRSFSREPENFFARSQDLAPTYFDVGQFYVARREVWLKLARFHEGGTAIEVKPGSLIDVDTEADWIEAERVFEVQA